MLTEEEILTYSRMPASAWLATFGDSNIVEPTWNPKPPKSDTRLVFQSHIHDEMEIHQIRRGELDTEINGKHFTLRAGDVLIVNPYELHSGTVPQDIVTEYIHVNFDLNFFTGSCSEANAYFRALLSGEMYYPTFIPANNPVCLLIGKALDRIYCDYQTAIKEKNNIALADFNLSLSIQKLIALLLKNIVPQKSDGAHIRNSRFIRDVQQYVSKYYRGNITTEQIAKDIGYNTSYFCTIFKQNFGISFKQYLNERRIEYATTWLRNLPLSEIPEALGFSDYNYFCRVFKKHTGVTPTEVFDKK